MTATGRVQEVLAEIVAEKTGYPAEMLEPDMQLDSDLGIDSIKRVEILSAVQERLPEAPVVRPEHLGTLRTLRHIAEFLAQSEVAPATTPAPDDVQTILTAIVAEKTGYPAEMLEPDMQLDSDLGIDSIKRVEILSAVQERLPEAPVVRPEHLGTLRTLRHIAEFLAQSEVAPATTPAPDDVQTILTAIVAEKTGYPAEMLEPDMQLDSDLGIDSIKRVEILSAVQERLPDAPVVRPEHLGTLRTLRHIAEFLASSPSTAPASPATGPVPASPPSSCSLQRLAVTSVALGEGREAIALREGAEVWIVDDGGDLAPALAARLRASGYRGRVVGRAEIGRPNLPERLDGLVLLAPDEDDDDDALKASFRLLRAAAPALRRAGREGSAVFATVTRLDGAFGLRGPGPDAAATSGGLAGLAKTAAREWPEVACKAIDLDPAVIDPDRAAALLLDELLRRGPVEVGLSDAGRTTLGLSPLAPPGDGGTAPIGPGDVVVISGGARGVTAEAAVALAAAFRPTVVLLGRSPEPSREPDWLAPLGDEAEIKRALVARANGHATPQVIGDQFRGVAANREVVRNLRRIEEAGGRAVYRSVDVRDAEAVAACLAAIRDEFGPVRALVHGAGVLADRRIEDQTDEQFAAVLDTKVAGLRALLAATAGDDLRALALFSSSTARYGRAGQVAYAAANEALNKAARREAARRPGCRVVAINWGPWDGGMVTPSLRPLFEAEGIGLIPLQDGARLLVEELRAPAADRPVEVVVLGPGARRPT